MMPSKLFKSSTQIYGNISSNLIKYSSIFGLRNDVLYENKLKFNQKFHRNYSLKIDDSLMNKKFVNNGITYSSLATNFIANDEKSDFDAVLPELIKDLTDASKNGDLPEVRDWFSKVLRYNIAGGKNIRGLSLVYSYKLLAEHLNGTNIKLSYILGWCVEMLQGFFLVIDDIQDESETRRGLPSWYKLEEVGQASAINDGLLIESGIYKILKIYFKHKPYYLDLIELFHDTTLKTLYGQGLDLMAAKWASKKDYTKFHSNTYFTIIKYKTAHYTFHMPVALALYMAGIKDIEIHKKAKDILLDIGYFFQIQDDYLDCYGDFSKTGKIGSDIREGKCTWLAINALQLSDLKQITIFKENYGDPDLKKIEMIKQLYDDLDLEKLYKNYEKETYDKIVKNIYDMKGVPHEIFTNLLNVIFKRIK